MRLFTLLLLLVFGYSQWMPAQSSLWTNYTKTSSINDFLDEETELYIATDAGIFVFDKATKAVTHWHQLNTGLPSNQVESIKRDPATQQIFIGTYDLALAVLEGDDWRTLPYPEEITDVYPNLLTYDIEFTDDGYTWVGTDQGLLRYDGENWKMFNNQTTEFFMFSVWSLDKDADGNLLVGGNVVLRTSDGEQFEQLTSDDFSDPNHLFAYSNALLRTMDNGDVWFFTDIGSAGRYHGNEWEVYQNDEIDPGQWLSSPGFTAQDRDGRLWVHFPSHGYYRFDDGAWESMLGALPAATNPLHLYFGEDFTLQFTAGGMSVITAATTEEVVLGNYPFDSYLYNFKTDAAGQLWANDGYGMIRNLDTGEELTVQLGESQEFIIDYDFAEDGALWTSNFNKVMKKTAGGWEVFDAGNSALPASASFRNLKAANGKVWLAAYDHGLFYYDGQEWINYDLPVFIENYIYALEPSENGEAVWLSIYIDQQHSSLYYFDGTDLQMIEPEFELPFSYVIHRDPVSGLLWLGGEGNTLTRYDGATWEKVEIGLQLEGSEFIREIVTRGDHIFLQTNKNILHFNGESWTAFNAGNSPMLNTNILDVGLDADGSLWISYGNKLVVDVYQTGLLATAIGEPSAETSLPLRVYPNPAAEQLRLLNLTEETGTYRYQIRDMHGRPVASGAFAGNQPIDVARLAPGMYTIELSGEAVKMVGRFVRGGR